MGILCNLFDHKWDGCTCSRCGEVRNEGHHFEYSTSLICAKCGGIRLQLGKFCQKCEKPLTAENRSKDHPAAICTDCEKGAKPEKTHLLVQLHGDGYSNDQHFLCLECGRDAWICEEGKSDYTQTFVKSECEMSRIKKQRSWDFYYIKEK